MAMDDWRLQGQERYLYGVELVRKRYARPREGWDHDHCEFCGAEFSEQSGALAEGFTTLDAYHWVCPSCFEDFKEQFAWRTSSQSPTE